MQDTGTYKKGYILAAVGGAAVGAVTGGILVAVVTKAFTKLMGSMRNMMSQ